MLKKLAVLLIVIFLIPINVNAASLLSDLQVEGIGSLELNKNSWNLSLGTPYDYVNITATPIDSSVTVEGAGQVAIQEGANTITITASNGSQTENYTINLNVTKKSGSVGTGAVSYDKDANIINPETGAFLPLGIIITIGIGAIVSIVYLRKNKVFNRL